jgi:archaetidylinositol phosphate synthase
MLEQWIRPIYQQVVVRPIIPFLSIFTPSQVTIIGGVMGISSGIFIVLQHPVIAVLLLLLSGLCDTLDGSLAREFKQHSIFGCVLDVCIDRLVESAVILGLFFSYPAQRAAPSLLMLVSILLCVTSFLLVGIFSSDNHSQKSFNYSPGLMERAEAFLFFIAMIWFAKFFNLLAYLFTALTFFTAGQRLYQFKQHQKRFLAK